MLVYVVLMEIVIILTGKYRLRIVGGYYFDKYNYKQRFQLAIAILIVFSAIRYNIGYDWNNYRIIIDSNLYYLYKREPISEFIFYIGSLTKQPIISFSIFSIIIYVLAGMAIWQNSKDRGKSLILYIALFYIETLSTIRSAAATSILFWGFKYIREKNLKNYLLVCLIATCVHNFAVVAIVIYFIYWMKKKYYILMLEVLYCFGGLIVNILLQMLSHIEMVSRNLDYINNNMSGRGYKAIFIIFTIYCLAMIYTRYGNLGKLSKEQEGYIRCCLVGIYIPIIFGGVLGIRLATLFCIYLTLLWVECDYSIKKEHRWITFVPALACFIGIMFVVSGQGEAYIPYKSYIDIWTTR